MNIHGVKRTIVKWVVSRLKSKRVFAKLGSTKRSVSVCKGCSQGGVLSHLLWCLVLDDYIRVNGLGLYTQAYAGDIVVGSDSALALEHNM